MAITDVFPTQDHMHKFYLFQVKSVYEPVAGDFDGNLYSYTEYAYLSCNCGTVIREKVIQK